MDRSKNVIHIIAGPTASGKSARALELAEKLDGIIINCDSIQIYDGLPILTARPSADDLEAAPHRLYGTRDPNDICSAGNWREEVLPLIEEILNKGQTPIVVGGTGLYIKSLTEGLSPIPDTPEDLRQSVVNRQKELGNPAFFDELKQRDPVMAERLHPYHTARLIRAYEVIEATGRSLADWQNEPKEGPPADWHFEIEKILPERDVLYYRCNTRFEQMLDKGALEEVETFQNKLDNGEVEPHVPLTKALGFKQLSAYLRGEISKDEAITRSQGETRRYAKRQVTWFRHQL